MTSDLAQAKFKSLDIYSRWSSLMKLYLSFIEVYTSREVFSFFYIPKSWFWWAFVLLFFLFGWDLGLFFFFVGWFWWFGLVLVFVTVFGWLVGWLLFWGIYLHPNGVYSTCKTKLELFSILIWHFDNTAWRQRKYWKIPWEINKCRWHVKVCEFM